MEFEESLNQVAAKVRDLKEGIETEEATKNAFIMPFIGQVLGYDVFNPTEVVPEFTADVGVKIGSLHLPHFGCSFRFIRRRAPDSVLRSLPSASA